MSNMSYCRHENTARDLADVWDQWEDGAGNEYEEKARKRIVRLVAEMHDQFVLDGTYVELGIDYDEMDG